VASELVYAEVGAEVGRRKIALVRQRKGNREGEGRTERRRRDLLNRKKRKSTPSRGDGRDTARKSSLPVSTASVSGRRRERDETA
jgi:hypothetical protein